MSNISTLWRPLWLALLLVLPAATTTVKAQQKLTLKVASFTLDSFDDTAKNPQYSRTDGNGDLFAIIKVKSTNPLDDLAAYSFNFALMNHQVDNSHGDELWVYVQRNAKNMTITREGYTPIKIRDLNLSIEAGRTYNLLLEVPTPEVKKRFLQFTVKPLNVNAVVKVKRKDSTQDYELWGAVDATGSKARLIETGEWLYEVSAPNYQTSRGSVKLTDGTEPLIENVALLPAFGFLEVDDAHGIAGAEIFVDNRKVGTVPYNTGEPWQQGQYHITILNGELYKPYNATFEIRPGETTRLSPKLEANFAETTIKVEADADILIDGRQVGQRQWTGPLPAGTYNVECRQNGCRPSTRLIQVLAGVSDTFTMEAPSPITGTLNVNSDPLGAIIQLDGNNIGTTPKSVEVPIGQHQLQVLKQGYVPQTRDINIVEGSNEDQSFTLDENTTPDVIKEKRKKEKEIRDSLRRAGKSANRDNDKLYEPKSRAFIMAALQAGSLMEAELGAGLRVGSFTVEASYGLGLSKSEDIYWNPSTDPDDSPVQCSYKPTCYSLRLGYGFNVSHSLCLTPQVGTTIVNIKADGSKGNATAATLGLKAELALAPHVALYAAPEMGFAVTKSDVYKQLADVSSKINSWAGGFNCRLGLSISF